MRRGAVWVVAGAAIVAVIVVAAIRVWPDDAQPGARRNDTMTSVSPPPPGALTIVAAGDICPHEPDPCLRTADLVSRLQPDAVLALGDNQYDDGTIEQYRSSYDRAWGRFAAITYPVAGNHEWHTPGAEGFLTYFDRSSYWYTFTIRGWRFYALDGTCDENGGCAPGDEQYRWLQSQLADRDDRCILAYWHQPRFSSGIEHGSDEEVAPLWQLLDDAGGDLVLSGHEHNYERFAGQDVDGQADAAGMVQIVAGTGGTPSGYAFGDPLPNSEVRLGGSGVVELGLHDDGWIAQFIRPSGEVSDQAEGSC
ncbi:MAG: metallophosphoesterase family protein [Actinomycetota bacterium]